MRFFSNEAKDNVDDQDVRTDAVPQQRPGSPWDDRPGDSTDAAHDAASRPTAFGAADDRGVTPGDSAIDDDRARANEDTVAWPTGEAPADRDPEVDVPLDEHRDSNPRTDDAVTGDATDDVLDDRDTTVDAHDAHDTLDDSHVAVHRADDDQDKAEDDLAAEDRIDTEDRADTGNRVDDAEVDEALEDRGTFTDPQIVDEDEDKVDDDTSDTTAEPIVATPVAVEPVTEPELESEPVVAVAAIPEPTTPAATPAATTGSATLFPEAETQPLRDRWRDIQLRFVDDPKASTAEAATLVDETIEKLTAALREHRGSLAGGGDDTEALRVELRSYRDILDRLLGL
ncbi:hypothetical protein [Actinoplanes sp. L3-i22]|uniref:hypothetical protein n=1 Tax=Actinoplanes sp. L3-i22 TaxID=2836373 RepID=UPI001C78CD36|nr:hypothetical protein [Actinoplanes sp. L3-i22]BCY06043.1 hypothetical protein L3i22_011310 [Actinoplanes sp. L3-i22]